MLRAIEVNHTRICDLDIGSLVSFAWKWKPTIAMTNNGEPSCKPTAEAIRKYSDFFVHDLVANTSECIVESPEDGWPSIGQ